MVDHLVDGITRLDHQHHAPRTLQQADEFLEGMCSNDLGSLCLVGHKVIYFGYGAVEDGYLIAVVVHV